jgi:hypothetical protein
MAYILNGTTLPNPKEFNRRQIEMSQVIQLLDGTTKKDITNRKEQFVLEFRYLTQAQVGIIIGIYNLLDTVNFQVTETNLTIAPTAVHVEIGDRQYNAGGDEYREDITLILTETK